MKSFLISILLLYVAAVNAPTIYGAVVINEIFPKTADPSQQWIELYNDGDQSVSLDRWKITNATGEVKIFTMNASAIIGAHNFLTFSNTQTGITLQVAGDTVHLFDEKNNGIDDKSYQGILGYNTSMGRTIDGKGEWVICTTATKDQQNNCPTPTSTPIPPTLIPTPIPSPTIVIPTATVEPSPTQVPTSVPTQITPTILVETVASPSAQQKNTAPILPFVIGLISVVWGILLAFIFVYKRKNNPV